jgi:hypothetical protein
MIRAREHIPWSPRHKKGGGLVVLAYRGNFARRGRVVEPSLAATLLVWLPQVIWADSRQDGKDEKTVLSFLAQPCHFQSKITQ